MRSEINVHKYVFILVEAKVKGNMYALFYECANIEGSLLL